MAIHRSTSIIIIVYENLRHKFPLKIDSCPKPPSSLFLKWNDAIFKLTKKMLPRGCEDLRKILLVSIFTH